MQPCLSKQSLKIQKMQSISAFPVQQKLVISGEKMLMSAELKKYVKWFIYILDLL